MVTLKDLFEVSCDKMIDDIIKSAVRVNFQPSVAEGMCASVDGHERVEHFLRFLREYNEWLLNQQRLQMYTVVYEGVL